MPRHRAGSILRMASFRALMHRFTVLVLMVLALAFMVFDRSGLQAIERLRVAATDALTPIMSALSQPVATFSALLNDVRAMAGLYEDNVRLRGENEALRQWQNSALQLQAENREIRKLLNFMPEGSVSFISARVVADTQGAFVRSALVNAGEDDGVRKGQVVVTGEGLVGRVGEAGRHSARILFLTDLNTRIPIITEETRERAILSGDNSERPHLRYLVPTAQVKVGERVITSGHGGVFPAGIPVGAISRIDSGEVQIRPFVDVQRIEYVRIIDFGLSGIINDGLLAREEKNR